MHVAIHPDAPSPGLVRALRASGFEVVPVADAAGVVEAEPGDGWALVVVEVAQDAEMGLAVARRVRSDVSAPVLVVAPPESLTALDGADFDDFILAPVDPAELAVRAGRLALGAGVPAPDEVISFKDLSLNLATYQATVGSEPIDLTYMEYELLRFFATNSGRVWSREQLLNRVWGYDYFGGARTVDVHVRRLRAKLGEERSSWITTVRSVGYRFG
jgi:DNA-binding response OmpR family regulator